MREDGAVSSSFTNGTGALLVYSVVLFAGPGASAFVNNHTVHSVTGRNAQSSMSLTTASMPATPLETLVATSQGHVRGVAVLPVNEEHERLVDELVERANPAKRRVLIPRR